MLALLAFACGSSVTPPASPSTPVATALFVPSTGSDVPAQRDLVDLAARLRGLPDLPRRVDLPPPALGDVEEFELLILAAEPGSPPDRRRAAAALRAVTEHAYLFVEEGATVSDAEVAAAARVFEDEVWPAVAGAFGLPPTPGVDGDPRIALVHADLGPAVGGYVTDRDAFPRVAARVSSGRETVYLNSSLLPLDSVPYKLVLAHELQHVIHRGQDFDEASWVNEGLSEVAAALLGAGGTYASFLDRPDTQLTTWASAGASGAHYDASDLFFAYLLEQTGGDVRDLTGQQENGGAGVQAFLEAAGSTRTFAQVVADWAVANFLDLPEGPYGYREREVSEPVSMAIGGSGEGEVFQFAADYLEVRAADVAGEPVVFVFEGASDVAVLAAQDDADGPFWWSGRGDNMDATLTRELDLTAVSEATLTFRTWYDIERWYDYSYVVASRDGGRTWQPLSGRQTTDDDPADVAYGPGYTGRSGGGGEARWVEEEVDLSDYAGARILIRFEYLTDGGLNRPGWAIDDIAVPEIGFFDDGARDVGGWHREGFRLLSGRLDQHFELRLITLGATPAVEEVAVDARNRASVALAGLGSSYSRAVIIVLGATDGTTEPARYTYELQTPARQQEGG